MDQITRIELPNKTHAPSSLGHMPPGRWAFDDEVTRVFDDMLARSVPCLEVMRSSVESIVAQFIRPGTHVVDLGCSRGGALAPLLARFGSNNRYLGIEASVPMFVSCLERFREAVDSGVVTITNGDFRTEYPKVDASVTLCILTLMFTPIEHRFAVLGDAYAHTLPRGAFVLVEKVLGADALLQSVLTREYYEHKRRMGYTDEEIDRKRLSLEGVLVPMTAEWNEQMLRNAGFAHVECFWRSLNFAAWLAVK